MSKAKSIVDKAESVKLAFWLWLISLLVLVFIVTVIGTAWAVRHAMLEGPLFSPAQSRFIIKLSEFPVQIRTAIQQISFSDELAPLLLNRKEVEQPNWIRRFPSPEDSGYLLLSALDPTVKHSTVQLIRVSDGKTVARWDPDWSAIYEKITEKTFTPKGSKVTLLPVHPLLLADGDIIFNTANALVRMSTCSSQPRWVLDEEMHHSNELDVSGEGIWVPSVVQNGYIENPWLQKRLRDDALAHVNLDGRIIERRSFARILRDNGLEAMLLGHFGLNFSNSDPIHLNQIKVASRDSRYWKRGDLLISSRHLSTIFLYRPSTNKILWYRTGPWMNQHSVDFVDDHRISVFDNNVVGGVPREHAFMAPGDTNHVEVYDFATNRVSQPFADLLAQARPVTVTAGRARVLPDGGLFIEETEFGRHLRFTRDRLLWSRVNDYDENRIGAVFSSRYMTPEEVQIPMQALASKKCLAVQFR